MKPAYFFLLGAGLDPVGMMSGFLAHLPEYMLRAYLLPRDKMFKMYVECYILCGTSLRFVEDGWA